MASYDDRYAYDEPEELGPALAPQLAVHPLEVCHPELTTEFACVRRSFLPWIFVRQPELVVEPMVELMCYHSWPVMHWARDLCLMRGQPLASFLHHSEVGHWEKSKVAHRVVDRLWIGLNLEY